MTDGVSRGERELQDLEVQWLAVAGGGQALVVQGLAVHLVEDRSREPRIGGTFQEGCERRREGRLFGNGCISELGVHYGSASQSVV